MNSPVRNSAKAKGSSSVHGKYSGLFITFEGGEGSGKSSQIKLLADRLQKAGYEVVITREPGGSPGGEAVRHVLLSGAAEHLGPDMEAILFSASRSDHVDTLIEPALKAGKIVLCDRFIDSTRVYQGVEGNVSTQLLHQLEKVACGSVWPDLTMIIDLDPKEGMKRASERRHASEAPDRFEKISLTQQKKRRTAFLDIAAEEAERCRVIDGMGTLEEVSDRIWNTIEPVVTSRMKSVTKPYSKSGRKPATKAKPKLMSHKALTRKKSTSNKK